ncbi:Importin alpha subunit [Entamoeba marina]
MSTRNYDFTRFWKTHNKALSDLRMNRRQQILESRRLGNIPSVNTTQMEDTSNNYNEILTLLNFNNCSKKEMYERLISLETYFEEEKIPKTLDLELISKPLLIYLINDNDIMLRYHIVTVLVLICQITLTPSIKELGLLYMKDIISKNNHPDLNERSLRLMGNILQHVEDAPSFNIFLETILIVRNKPNLRPEVTRSTCWSIYILMTKISKHHPMLLPTLLPHVLFFLGNPDIMSVSYMLWGIGSCIEQQNEFVEIINNFTEFLNKLCCFIQSGVESIVQPSARLIACVLSQSNNYTQLFVDDGLLQILPKIFHDFPPDAIVPDLLMVISNCFLTSPSYAEVLVQKNVPLDVVKHVLKQNGVYMKESIWTLSNIVQSCSKRQDLFQMLVQQRVCEAIVFILDLYKTFDIEEVMATIDACILLLTEDKNSPEIGSYQSLVEFGIKNALEKMRYDNSIGRWCNLKVDLILGILFQNNESTMSIDSL